MSYKKEINFLDNNKFEINVLSYNYGESNGYSQEHAALTCLSETKEDKFLVKFNNEEYEILIENKKNIDHYQAQEDEFIDQKTTTSHKKTIIIRNLSTNVSEKYIDDLLYVKDEIPHGIRELTEKIKQKAIDNNITAKHRDHWNDEDDSGRTYSNRGGYSRDNEEDYDFDNDPIYDYYKAKLYQAKSLPISEEEVRDFDQYVELKNELVENKKIVKFSNEKQLTKLMTELTGSGDFNSDKYSKIERKILAFIEIERIEEELSDFLIKAKESAEDVISIDLLSSQFDYYLGGFNS